MLDIKHRQLCGDGFTLVYACIQEFKLRNTNQTVLSHIKDVMLLPLWTTEMVPGHWRAGDIVNLFKKGDKQDLGNYRGITLLNVVGKLYTKVIDSRLSAWLDTHDRLHVCQAGFRSQRSCIDHVD